MLEGRRHWRELAMRVLVIPKLWSSRAGEWLPRALPKTAVAGGMRRITRRNVMGRRELVGRRAWDGGHAAQVAREGASEVGIGRGDDIAGAGVWFVMLSGWGALPLLERTLSKTLGADGKRIKGCRKGSLRRIFRFS